MSGISMSLLVCGDFVLARLIGMSIAEGQREITHGPQARRTRPPGPHSRGHSLLSDMDWSSPEGRIIVAARRE
jgi:hypothetical protein